MEVKAEQDALDAPDAPRVLMSSAQRTKIFKQEVKSIPQLYSSQKPAVTAEGDDDEEGLLAVMADEGACLCTEAIKLGARARRAEEEQDLEASLQGYDMAIKKATRAQALWTYVYMQKSDPRLTSCIEWARGFVLQERLFRGLICGWMSNLDEALADFVAVSTSSNCLHIQFSWVVDEARICLGHTLSKYGVEEASQIEVAEIAKALQLDPEALCRYKKRALQVKSRSGESVTNDDAVAAASMVQLRHSPVKSSPPTPLTPRLSPHVSRFILSELTNVHKRTAGVQSPVPDQQRDQRQQASRSAVPKFEETGTANGAETRVEEDTIIKLEEEGETDSTPADTSRKDTSRKRPRDVDSES